MNKKYNHVDQSLTKDNQQTQHHVKLLQVLYYVHNLGERGDPGSGVLSGDPGLPGYRGQKGERGMEGNYNILQTRLIEISALFQLKT